MGRFHIAYASLTEAVGITSGFNSKPESEEEAVWCSLESVSNTYPRIKEAAEALVLACNSRGNSSIQNLWGQLLTMSLRFLGFMDPETSM